MSEKYIDICVQDETAPLEAVILGTARELHEPFQRFVDPSTWDGDRAPDHDHITDPKSRYHLMNGSYPLEVNLRTENDHFSRVLAKYNVDVFKPITLPNTNQIFTRDIGFVIDEVFIKSNMGTLSRQAEFFAIRDIVSLISQEVWFPPRHVKIEGGDAFPFEDKIYVGQAGKKSEGLRCDRTNRAAIDYLQEKFPEKEVVPIYLNKSDKDPYNNCLHLDCAFQPLGNNDHCVIFRDGFTKPEQADMLIEAFGGSRNTIEIGREQMFFMNSNIFSISPNIVVSGADENEFGAINNQLEEAGFIVEKIPYSETAKMEGLLRCSTLPLRRNYRKD